ncbi:hypothetical protein TD95_003581 [Thielaviopsis punctulata]|uniref:Major facilitator superfamily (MFS) profile domain-containing protein n=1 Tax=Thielaviopsis punctulata TaxID=72032 RepID=A0A0F4ZHN4_9PEZI|nr:hypothetical protein TD95_003581 [Thielaviopsis punctulata]
MSGVSSNMLPAYADGQAPAYTDALTSGYTNSQAPVHTDSPSPTILFKDPDVTVSNADTPPLGVPHQEKRFWWQRTRNYDPSAIATLPSVYDDPATAKLYMPRNNWENLHRFDPMARWTWGEEYRLIRKIDVRIMVFTCIMFMALELDRANIAQAISGNMLSDLQMTTNDYNLGNTVFKLAFLCAELPSQLVSKWVGPDRWIPMQITLWSIVASSQFWLHGKTSFLVTRALLGMLQGGFIPDVRVCPYLHICLLPLTLKVVLYLSYFYKHHELSLRLSFFWTSMSIADIIAGLLAAGILNLGHSTAHAGWRWLFLIDGLLTLTIGLLAFVLMPASPTQTASWFRGKSGWFTPREEVIIINRVMRDDPSKGDMHNRQPITPALLWQSICDYDLWPVYILGLIFGIGPTPPKQYLTLILRGLGFDTFHTNLLSIPATALHILTLLGLTYGAEVRGELGLTTMISQVWVFPFLVFMATHDLMKVNKWAAWGILTVLLGYPYPHALQVGWNSRNSNTVRTRTVSAAIYNMSVQASDIIASNIYRKDDAPAYYRGNRQLAIITGCNIIIYILVKVYYVWRNKTRDQKWNAMTTEQQKEYLETTTDEGNKRLDFRFTH